MIDNKKIFRNRIGIVAVVLMYTALGVFLFSCVEESVRKGKPLAGKAGSIDTTETVYCSESYYISEQTCRSRCPIGTHAGSVKEITAAKAELENQLFDDKALLQEIYNNIDAASEVCVEGSGVLRPDGQVKVNSDVCICQSGKRVTLSNCESFCSSKTSAELTLYGTVKVGPDIAFNDSLGNLQGWCNNEIPNSDFKGPGCQLEVAGDGESYLLDISVTANSFRTTADLSGFLSKETPYIVRIIENQSGSNVTSDSFQIYLKEIDDSETPVGPLKIMPVSQYQCIFRSTTTDSSGQMLYQEYARQQYYFAASRKPSSLPPDNPRVVCHDIQTYGEDDSSIYPRLNLIPKAFAVWDQSDSRFNSPSEGARIRINQTITDEYKVATGQTNNASISLDIFTVFSWRNLPSIDDFKEVTNSNLGLVMIPFVDSLNRGVCPTREHYLGDDTLFKIIGDKVGIDTEGLYMAESDPYKDGKGGIIIDIALIKESDLKSVWFYSENGKLLIPDEITAGSKTIKFFWPIDKSNPYVKKTHQRIFTVKYPNDIGKNGVVTGVVTGDRPSDKRFACIPTSE